MRTAPRPVDRVGTLFADEFAREFRAANRPVVVTGEVPTWPAFTRWTPAKLVEQFGDRPVRTHVDHEGLYTNRKVEKVMSTVGAFFDDLAAGARDRFVIESSLEMLPWLVADYSLPRFIDESEADESVIWIAPQRTRTGLHWDAKDNLLAVVRGTKRVWLFSPDQHELLYPHPLRAPAELENQNWSQIDVFAVDEECFPKTRDAVFHEVELEMGSMLFIPENWWHAVQNEGDINIAVSCWLVPPTLRPGPSFYQERCLLAGAMAIARGRFSPRVRDVTR